MTYRAEAITQEDIDILVHRLRSETARADSDFASMLDWHSRWSRESARRIAVTRLAFALALSLAGSVVTVAFFDLARFNADQAVIEAAEAKVEAAERRELSFRRILDDFDTCRREVSQ